MYRSLGPQSYLAFAVRYAFRNLWRNGRRTTLTTSTVLFAVAVAIVANRYSAAVMKLWQDGAADTGSAHAQLHAKHYWQKPDGLDLELTLPYGNAFEHKMRDDPSVESVVRRLELEGIISLGEESVYFIGKGVEPAGELAVSPRLFTHNDEGRFVSEEDKAGVAIGKGLAESLGVKIGDEATLITQTIQGSVNGIDVKVVGIVDAAIPSFSKRVVYVHIEHLQRLIRMPDRYTELAVRLKPGVDIEHWVAAQQAAADSAQAELRGWWEIEPVIKNVERIWDSVVIVITLLLFLSTALSVLNIVFMMVAERTTEIGMLMAIGARQGDVRFLFCLEAALIGMGGGLGGAVIGNALVYAMSYFGVPFDSPFDAGKLMVYPQVQGEITVLTGLVAVVVCCFAALTPAHKAASVAPAKAFQGQIT